MSLSRWSCVHRCASRAQPSCTPSGGGVTDRVARFCGCGCGWRCPVLCPTITQPCVPVNTGKQSMSTDTVPPHQGVSWLASGTVFCVADEAASLCQLLPEVLRWGGGSVPCRGGRLRADAAWLAGGKPGSLSGGCGAAVRLLCSSLCHQQLVSDSPLRPRGCPASVSGPVQALD